MGLRKTGSTVRPGAAQAGAAARVPPTAPAAQDMLGDQEAPNLPHTEVAAAGAREEQEKMVPRRKEGTAAWGLRAPSPAPHNGTAVAAPATQTRDILQARPPGNPQIPRFCGRVMVVAAMARPYNFLRNT